MEQNPESLREDADGEAPSPDSIIAWLSALGMERAQSQTFAKRVEGTSDWILHHPKFLSWLAGRSHSPVLWCHGLACAGKTVSTSIVVDHLQRTVAGPRTAVAFIYCDEEVRPVQTTLALLSSLCAQLVAQCMAQLPPLLVKLYQETVGTNGGRRPDIDEVILMTMALCDGSFDRIFICVDGLDEVLREGERPVLIQKLQWMWNRGARVFVTSQIHSDMPETCHCNEDITIALQDCDNLLVEAIEDDITKSVWAHLRSRPDNGEKILVDAGFEPADVVAGVVDDCGGMFVMAQLKLDRKLREVVTTADLESEPRCGSFSSVHSRSSSRARHSEASAILAPCPDIEVVDAAPVSPRDDIVVALVPYLRPSIWQPGLEAIEKQASKLRQKCAMMTLSWVLHAEEPLRASDLTIALAMEMTSNGFWVMGSDIWVEGLDINRIIPRPSPAVLEKSGPSETAISLIDVCEGLICIDDNYRVAFTEPWNISQAERARMFPKAHLQMAYICLRLWCKYFDENRPRSVIQGREDDVSEQTRERYVPLKEYTQQHWPAHLLSCDHRCIDDLVVEFLCKLFESKPTWIEKRQPSYHDQYFVRVTDNETPVLKSARLGLNRVLRVLLESRKYPIDTVSYKRETAISAAVLAGHTSTVHLLRKYGTCASMHYRDIYGDSLLHMAVKRDDEIMVALILELGLDKNTLSVQHAKTALHAAIGTKSVNAVRTLLQYGCDTLIDPPGDSLLKRATRSGNLELVELLVEYGVELDPPDSYSAGEDPPLFDAIGSGSELLVEYMLRNGARVDRLDGRRSSAFHRAARQSNLSIVELLFEYCHDPMIPYREDDGPNEVCDGTTAVEEAMRSKNFNGELVEFLLARMPPGIPSPVLLGMATGGVSAGLRDAAKQLILMASEPLQHSRRDCASSLIGVAIGKDDEEILALLLDHGMSPIAADKNGWGPLHIAAYDDSPKAAALLIEHGADVNAQTKHGLTPIHVAVNQGTVATLRVLLDQQPDLSIRAVDGSTALVAAGLAKQLTAARMLVDYGTDVSKANIDGETILHFAVMDGDAGLVQMLLDRGIDLSICSRRGGTALHYAAYKGETEIVKFLLEHGAEVDLAHEYTGNGFQPPREYGRTSGILWNQIDTKRNEGSQYWGMIEPQWTALHSAACIGHLDVADMLLARGANISARGAKGETPLHVAASAAKTAVIKLLVAKGADVCETNVEGDTALHWAALAEAASEAKKASEQFMCFSERKKKRGEDLAHPDHSKSDCIAMLMELGVDPTAENAAGMAPLAVAVVAGHGDIVDTLMPHMPPKMFTPAAYISLIRACREKASASALQKISEAVVETVDSRTAWCELLGAASIAGRLDLVTLAISKGATPTAQAANGENPLHRAISAEHIEIIDALLAAGADIAAVDDKGRNALHLASSHKALRTLTVYPGSRKKEHMATAILRQDGVQVNWRTAGGDTALYFAAATGDEMLVMALLKHGASVDIRNRAGRTPMHSAVSWWAFPGIVEMLLWHGASPRAVDTQGRTAAHLIRTHNPKGREVLNLLVQHGADAAAAARNGDRPAHCAVRRNNWALVKRLLEVGASVSDEGAHRRTVLHVAARRGHAAMIGPLVTMGADVGALDADGWTPMRHAREKKRVEVMDVLSRYGVNGVVSY